MTRATAKASVRSLAQPRRRSGGPPPPYHRLRDRPRDRLGRAPQLEAGSGWPVGPADRSGAVPSRGVVDASPQRPPRRARQSARRRRSRWSRLSPPPFEVPCRPGFRFIGPADLPSHHARRSRRGRARPSGHRKLRLLDQGACRSRRSTGRRSGRRAISSRLSTHVWSFRIWGSKVLGSTPPKPEAIEAASWERSSRGRGPGELLPCRSGAAGRRFRVDRRFRAGGPRGSVSGSAAGGDEEDDRDDESHTRSLKPQSARVSLDHAPQLVSGQAASALGNETNCSTAGSSPTSSA